MEKNRNIEVAVLGYPSRVRLADWQRANSLREEQLPQLSKEQRVRAGKLHVREQDYAVALKAAELAWDHAGEKIQQVARLIAEVVKGRDPEVELTTLVWDFRQKKFEFSTRHNHRGRSLGECLHSIPAEIVDAVLLDKEGAEGRLKEAVGSQLS